MDSLIKPLKIGGFTCPSNLILAPMAGITDSPFRILCLKGGCGLVCAEMVSANGLKYQNDKSLRMLKISAEEHPLSMQVFGSDPDDIAAACRLAQEQGADVVDINAGCPVKKVNKAGAGCVLMKDPQKIGQIVAAAVKAVTIPVTLKTRISLNHVDILGPLLAKIAQDNGASAVVIHARAAVDVHSGPPNLKALEECCKSVAIPVIGNGGITDAESARDMFNAGCQGIMIGRGAIGNPFIFRDITASLSGNKFEPISTKEKLELYRELIRQNVKFYGERSGISRSKKTVGYWIKGFEGSSSVREALVRSESLSLTEEIFSAALNNKI